MIELEPCMCSWLLNLQLPNTICLKDTEWELIVISWGQKYLLLVLVYVLSQLSHVENSFHHWFHFILLFPLDFLPWITLGWSQCSFWSRKWANTYFWWILDSSNMKIIFIRIDTATIKALKLQWQNEKKMDSLKNSITRSTYWSLFSITSKT